jgi:hypothetical protein
MLSKNRLLVYLIATTMIAIMIANSRTDAVNVKHFQQDEEEEEQVPVQDAQAAIAENKVTNILILKENQLDSKILNCFVFF